MPKLPPKPTLNYSLRRRFFTEIGEALDWTDYGRGTFTDIETVHLQIKKLASIPRKVEIEFILNGKKCGFDGKETGENIIYDKR